MKKKITIVENPNLHGLITQVLNDRLKAIYVEKKVAKNILIQIKKNGDELVLFEKMPYDSHPFKISFQAKHQQLVNSFNQYLASPAAKLIYQKWQVALD